MIKSLIMKNKIILALMLSALCFTSCSRETSGVETPSVLPPVTKESYEYKFSRNGLSTVDLETGKEMIDLFYLLDNGMKIASSQSRNYYERKGSVYALSMKDITAASSYYASKTALQTAVRNEIEVMFGELKAISDNSGLEAKKGQAGFIGYEEERRYVDAYGIETGQVLQKALMGVALLDQVLNQHLGEEVLGDAQLQKDNSNLVMVTGKRYTALEHHWDRAYAYMGRENSKFTPLFIANYLEKETKDMPFLAGIDERVYTAFYKGRKAVVDKDYTEMKKQAAIIRGELNKLLAARAIYYLKKGIPDLREDVRNAFHGLSEAYGFIYALNVARKEDGSSYLSPAEINRILAEFRGEHGFWEVDRLAADESTKGSLLNLSKQIADKFGFKVNEV